MAKEKTADEQEAIRLATWWADQPLQQFEIVDGNGAVMHFHAHEVQVGSPQPILTLIRYTMREREEATITGKKEREEEYEPTAVPIILPVAHFNAGAWISCRDIEKSILLSPVEGANDGE